MRALIIDDIPDLRVLMGIMLDSFGIEHAEAGDGAQGLEALRTLGPFDFCTVDIFMPTMDGFTFVEAVRKDPTYKSMKILMVSTEVERKSVDKALKLGADEYVMKPYTKEILESKLLLLGLING